MSKKLIFNALLVTLLIFGIIPASHATDDIKTLLFYYSGSEDILDLLDSDDQNVKEIKRQIDSNDFKIEMFNSDNLPSFNDFDAIAYGYEDVKNNNTAKNNLLKSLETGKMIYLYGEFTYEEVYEILGTTISISIPSNDSKTYDFILKNTREESNNSKQLKNGDQKILISNEKLNVLGLSLNKNRDTRLLALEITITDEFGNKKAPDFKHYFYEISRHESKNSIQNKNNITTTDYTITSNTIVDSNDYEIKDSAWGLKHAGDMEAQWFLLQNNNETDETYDYFMLEEHILITDYNTFSSKELTVSHSLIFNSDILTGGQPGNSSSGPYQVSFSYPWNMNFSFNIDTNPKYAINTDWSNDTVSWTVTDNKLDSGDSYKFYTAWRSTGTLANIDSNSEGKWRSGIDVYAYANLSYSVYYDY